MIGPLAPTRETAAVTPDLLHDPVEDTVEFQRVVPAAMEKALSLLDADPMTPPRGTVGYAPMFWLKLTDVLRDDYGIDWQTPMQMNPRVCID